MFLSVATQVCVGFNKYAFVLIDRCLMSLAFFVELYQEINACGEIAPLSNDTVHIRLFWL